MYHFPWIDDFAAARNESLKYARGEWIFWMDSDDVIDAENGRKLRELVMQTVDEFIFGYVMQVHCPGPGLEGRHNVTVVDHIKLFRNRPDLRFEGRIHEQILGPIRRAGGEVAWSDVFVVHAGSDHSPEGQQRKLERDLRLLDLALHDEPEHPFHLFNLGMTQADAGRHEDAVISLRRSLAAATPGESHLRKVYALLISSLLHLERFEEAEECCADGRALYPEDPEIAFRSAMVHHERGRLHDAALCYHEALRQPEDRYFSSLDPGIRGFKARYNLASVYTDMGRLDLAEAECRILVDERPDYRYAWRKLGDNLIQQGKLEECLSVARRIEQVEELSTEGFLLEARIAGVAGNEPAQQGCLQQALRLAAPGDLEPLRSWCQFAFERLEPPDAAEALEQLVAQDPQDGAAHHNLGVVYMRLERYGEAVIMCRKSVELRPKSAITWLVLGHAYLNLGRLDEALASFGEASRLDPELPEAKQMRRELEP